MIWASLVGAPFHEKAITETQHHSENQDSVMVTDPAAVVVVGDIQALMQTALNAPGVPVETYPVCGIQTRGLQAGDQRHQFIFAAFFAALIDFLRISLSGRWLLRGKKPPAER